MYPGSKIICSKTSDLKCFSFGEMMCVHCIWMHLSKSGAIWKSNPIQLFNSLRNHCQPDSELI